MSQAAGSTVGKLLASPWQYTCEAIMVAVQWKKHLAAHQRINLNNQLVNRR
jgi:hypothetical protein